MIIRMYDFGLDQALSYMPLFNLFDVLLVVVSHNSIELHYQLTQVAS